MAELVDISLSAIKTESEMEIDTVEDALEHAADYAVEDAADDTTKQYEFEQIFIKVENDIVEENAEQEDIFSKEEDQDYPCIPGCAESEFVKETSKNNQLNFIDNLPLIHMKEEPAITNPVLCPRSDLVGNMRSRFLEILNNKSNNFLNTTENKSPEDPISQHEDDPAYILPDDNICGEVEECSVYVMANDKNEEPANCISQVSISPSTSTNNYNSEQLRKLQIEARCNNAHQQYKKRAAVNASNPKPVRSRAYRKRRKNIDLTGLTLNFQSRTSCNQLLSNVCIPVAKESPSGDLLSDGIKMVNGEILNKTVLQEEKSGKANCRQQQQCTSDKTEVTLQEEFVNEDN